MASVTITPDSNIYGETTTIAGTGFALTTAITITWDGTTLVTIPSPITTDGSGDFTATFEIPRDILGIYDILVTDGTTSITTEFEVNRQPEYSSVKDLADWLRITINANSDPSASMIKEMIMDNEDRIDIRTGHSWLNNKQSREIFHVQKLYNWGRGMPLFPRHRNIKPFDTSMGDAFEIWDGNSWVVQSVSGDNDDIVYFEEIRGTIYIRGYLFTILTVDRFRLTYRYGGNQEFKSSKTPLVPRTIKKACKLMTAIDILSTDFQMSQIAYGGEGNVDKQKIMDKWQDQIDEILRDHSEIISIW